MIPPCFPRNRNLVINPVIKTTPHRSSLFNLIFFHEKNLNSHLGEKHVNEFLP